MELFNFVASTVSAIKDYEVSSLMDLAIASSSRSYAHVTGLQVASRPRIGFPCGYSETCRAWRRFVPKYSLKLSPLQSQ
jgi:hypothetical protein